MIARTSGEKIEAIKNADPQVSDQVLAAELGVTDRTVRRYRREGRQEREAARRETIEQQVQQHTADHLAPALEDLAKLRRLVGAEYECEKDPENGRLWLATIKETLTRLGVEGEQDGLEELSTDDVLAELRSRFGAVV